MHIYVLHIITIMYQRLRAVGSSWAGGSTAKILSPQRGFAPNNLSFILMSYTTIREEADNGIDVRVDGTV